MSVKARSRYFLFGPTINYNMTHLIIFYKLIESMSVRVV